MATLQQKIKNRLKSLNEVDSVSVDTTKPSQITVSHKLRHVADFRFKWTDSNHYVGYFVDADGKESQAIVSLWTAMDAVKFLALYFTLVELRAKR